MHPVPQQQHPPPRDRQPWAIGDLSERQGMPPSAATPVDAGTAMMAHELRTRLESVAAALNVTIVETEDRLRTAGHADPYVVVDVHGRSVMAPMLCAYANALAAIAGLDR